MAEDNSEIERWKEAFDLSNDYLKIAKEASDNREDLDIPNSTLSHAQFLICLLLDKAENEIKIYSGSFDEKCYKNKLVKEALKNAAKRIKVKIIVEDGQKIAKELKIEGIKILELSKEMPFKNHFIVVDKRAYRFEREHPKNNVDQVNAIVNFNNPEISKELDAFFDLLYAKSSA